MVGHVTTRTQKSMKIRHKPSVYLIAIDRSRFVLHGKEGPSHL